VNYENIIKQVSDKSDIKDFALVGDSIYSAVARTVYIYSRKWNNPSKLESAPCQSRVIHKMLENLTDEEKEFIRSARNYSKTRVPKRVKAIDYRYATALEALLGKLFLKGDRHRLSELSSMITEIIIEFEN
jgi:ribonuclease-3 family protein